MRRKIAILFLVAFASLFGAACQPVQQGEIEVLETRVADLEEDVGDLQVVVGKQVVEKKQEIQQEKTQP
jgi:hypothetical protein